MPENANEHGGKNLQKARTGVYKPAYKQNPKTAEKQSENSTAPLPPDLAEIVEVWPELPEHIKAAVKALVQTDGGSNGELHS